MAKYLKELGSVLQQLQHHNYIEHPAGSRAMMRADLEHDLARVEDLRKTLAPAEQLRLDAEAKATRGMLKNLELAEGSRSAFWGTENPLTLH